jgi:hypothetical protein
VKLSAPTAAASNTANRGAPPLAVTTEIIVKRFPPPLPQVGARVPVMTECRSWPVSPAK